tara:strand:- start:4349 stop:5458 length:1110 start_codon:yes stop_codon:yes gene_type:complete
MEIKVKAVDVSGEEKSVQQVEQELLDKHEQQQEETPKAEEPKVEETPKAEEPKVEEKIETQSSELKEEDVLKFIGNRYGKEIKSLDELNQQREEEPLPEDVSKYLKYKKETGRGFDDFVKLNRNYDEMESDQLLKEYLTVTEKGLDAEDIDDLMEDYSFDEEIDDEKTIRKTKLAKKKIIAKARDFFETQKEQYSVPLESRREAAPMDESEEYKAYKQYIAEAKTIQEQNARKGEVFTEKTNNVFSEFKGFEFTLDDNKVYFSPGDADELKKTQLDPTNFIKKFLDEDGVMNDAEGYHKSLAMAMHPEKFAKFFYEQGKSQAADEQMKKLKNINMTTRTAPEVVKTKSGMQIKSLNPDSGRGLKIRKRK